MILGSNILLLLAAVITGSIKKWRAYYPTILFISFCNLLYNLICHDYLLWSFHPIFLLNHLTTDLLNTVCFLPCTTILYLNHFPMRERRFKQIIYYLIWVAGYSALEFSWFVAGVIQYHHGWNSLWSVGFYFFMFYVMKIHQPMLARSLLLSLIVIMLLILLFKVPISIASRQ